MEIIMSNIIKRTKGDLKYLFKDSDKLSPKALKRKQRGKRVAAGLVLVLIQLILTILFLFRIITFSILPVQYLLNSLQSMKLFRRSKKQKDLLICRQNCRQ